MKIKFRYPGIFFPRYRRRSREGLGVGWREPDRPLATNGEKLERRKPWRHKLSDLSAGRQVTGSHFIKWHFLIHFRHQPRNRRGTRKTHCHIYLVLYRHIQQPPQFLNRKMNWWFGGEYESYLVVFSPENQEGKMTLTSNFSRARNGEEEVMLIQWWEHKNGKRREEERRLTTKGAPFWLPFLLDKQSKQLLLLADGAYLFWGRGKSPVT